MPSAPPPGTNFWTLNAANISGGSDGDKLAGCHIVENTDYFTFTKPDWTVLSTSSGPPRPSAPFTFPTFNYKDIIGWSIGMSAPPTDPDSDWGADSWSFPAQPMIEGTDPGQSGEFTAQAGDELGEGEASSATA